MDNFVNPITAGVLVKKSSSVGERGGVQLLHKQMNRCVKKNRAILYIQQVVFFSHFSSNSVTRTPTNSLS